ncbi:MAG: methyltransferase domain-containing protein [Clostridia bacterium]|nr:methyltransferase domain-containing protein [Clostridia bacterium]
MFWDRVACVYDLFADVYNRKVHEQLKEAVCREIRKEDSVLECACGTGMLTCAIAPRCQKLVATDFSEKMRLRTEEKCRSFPNTQVQEADILNLPFLPESFDVVLAANVIHLLDDPMRAIHEMQRVCKKGGKLIIPTYMNREKTGKASTFSRAVGKAGADFRASFTLSSYKAFIREAGFPDAAFTLVDGRVPCAVAVIRV